MRGIRGIVISLVVFTALAVPTIVAAADQQPPDQANTTSQPAAPPTAGGAPEDASPAAEPVQTEPPSAAEQRKRGLAGEAQPAPRVKASSPTAQASALRYVVMQTGNKFKPATRSAQKGDIIEWINEDSIEHNVTANDGSFKSKNLTNGQTFRETFNKTGTFAYYCSLHGTKSTGMRGKVVVETASSSGGSGGTSSGSGSDGSGSSVTPPLATVAGGETSSSSSGDGSSGQLPSTGANLLVLALLGADLMLAGFVLREAAARRRT